MATDSTMELLERLKDPSQWVIREAVPIFKAHKRRKPDGSVAYEVKPEDLPVIAANSAALEAKSGVLGRITPGHVLPENTEPEQPKLYGVMRNYRYGTFGPSNEPAVLVDQYFFPATAKDAKGYPYRSAEYYPGKQEIRGLALLTRDPYLDLGMTTNASTDVCYRYSLDSDNKPGDTMEPTEDEKKQIEAMYAKHGKWLCSKYNLSADEMTEEEKKAAEEAEAAKKKEAEATNNALTVQAELYAKQNAVVTRLSAEVLALTKARDTEVATRLVNELVLEGYQLGDAADIQAEIAEMAGKDEAGRNRQVKRIRDRYQKVPTGALVTLYKSEGGPELYEAAIIDQADAIMRATPGMQFGEAYTKAKAQAGK